MSFIFEARSEKTVFGLSVLVLVSYRSLPLDVEARGIMLAALISLCGSAADLRLCCSHLLNADVFHDVSHSSHLSGCNYVHRPVLMFICNALQTQIAISIN